MKSQKSVKKKKPKQKRIIKKKTVRAIKKKEIAKILGRFRVIQNDTMAKRCQLRGNIKEALVKVAILILIISLNWLGLSGIRNTAASFSDTEKSEDNTFVAGVLDFELSSPSDFSPSPILPGENSTRTINIINNANPFKYKISSSDFSSPLCDYMMLEANTNGGSVEYSGPLKNFVYGPINFSDSSEWSFKLTPSDNAPKNLADETCQFKLIFFGSQTKNNLPFGDGFTDTEEISNNIGIKIDDTGVLINKIYYDTDAKHGSEPANEWIELYNSGESSADISGWKICDNTNCDTFPAFTTLPAGGFAIITGNSSTFGFWNVPAGTVKIILADGKIGGGLANDKDMLLLKNIEGDIVDQMNWGEPSSSWANYNMELWNPGISDAPEGRMLGRNPSGFDTDQVSDWKSFTLPEVKVIYPNGGEVWYVGRSYDIRWNADNPNGSDQDLLIDVFYSKDSGATWAQIADDIENDGIFNWRVPLAIGDYLTPSSKARIKVAAQGPENFMIWNWDMTDSDFCPPIDYSELTEEEIIFLEKMLNEGKISEDEVINEPVSEESPVVNNLKKDEDEEAVISEEPVIEDKAETNLEPETTLEENIEEEPTESTTEKDLVSKIEIEEKSDNADVGGSDL